MKDYYVSVPLPSTADDAVLCLQVPDDSERIWSDETGRPALRPLGGLGPKGHRPVGYLVPDGRIVLDAGAHLSEKAISYLRDLFTGPARDLHDVADLAALDERLRHCGTFGRCRLCENPLGKRHADRCPHAGKTVGDRVR